jgi:hypothetical protein
VTQPDHPGIRYTIVPDSAGSVQLTALGGTRLEELLAGYESAKAAFEDARARFEAVTAALKNEMASSAPEGSKDIALSGTPGLPRLRLRWKTSWRCDVKKFRAERPELYVKYEKQSGTWELRQDG